MRPTPVPHAPESLLHTLDGSDLTSPAYVPALLNTIHIFGQIHHVCGAVERRGEEIWRAGVSYMVRKVGDMRVKKGSQHLEGVDAASSASARAAGVNGLWSVLPLILVPEERSVAILSFACVRWNG